MIKYTLRNHSTLAVLLSIFVLASCGPTENTVVIEDAPISSGRTDTTEQEQEAEPAGSFTQLTIGENQAIRSLDPLFIENTSGMRAVQMMYEGLVQYNENAEVQSAIASDWTTSNSERTYSFTLDKDIFYQDSKIFSNGRGRRLVAADVKKAFERMAKADVPDHAAQLFMNIEGFEPYFQEQHRLMMSADRQLNEISGIEVRNDSTIAFTLVEPDEQFLQKLAVPYAVIYPSEALKGNRFQAVGSGPFRLSQQRSDTLHIFSRFDNYRLSDQPTADRVDIVTSTDQTALLNALKRGDIQLIPELGPQQMQMALGSNGQLNNTLIDNYRLFNDKRLSKYFLRYNEGADLSKNDVINALQTVREAGFFSNLPADVFDFVWALPQTSESSNADSSTPDSLSAAYSGDPFVRSFYSQLTDQLQEYNIAFSVSSSRVANRNVPVQAETFFPIEDVQMVSNSALVSISVQSSAIASNKLSNIAFNNLPWWIDLREVTIQSTPNR
jgi:ABC-type transport system substrate-binding protein